MDLSAVILAGGLGTRLRSVVNDRPKVMAPIGGRPFVTVILDQLNEAGVGDVLLCVGYMGTYIESELGSRYRDLSLRYSYEDRPLGTGGALRNALDLIGSDSALVLNGDSYCQCSFGALRAFHKERRAVGTLLVTRVGDVSRYGSIRLDEQGRIQAFEEKRDSAGPGWINAGVYVLEKGIIASIGTGACVSLERDLFPSLVGTGFYGFRQEGSFLDIGTPEDFARAGGVCERL